MPPASVQHDPLLSSGRCLAWHRASAGHTAVYLSRVRVLCEQLVIPDEVVRCSNPHCLSHCELLNSICHKLVQVRFKKLAGWNDETHPLRNPCSRINFGRKMTVLNLVFCFRYGSTLRHGIGMQ